MKWILWLALIGLAVWVWRVRAQGAALPAPGEDAPDFQLPDQSGALTKLTQFRGRWVALYFYPKDDTPGCTRQACGFRDQFRDLSALGVQVLGISTDDAASHEKFASKYALPFPLLADSRGRVAERYGSLLDLGLTRLAKRNTFLIDPQGRIVRVYRGADPGGNAAEVIRDLGQLIKTVR